MSSPNFSPLTVFFTMAQCSFVVRGVERLLRPPPRTILGHKNLACFGLGRGDLACVHWFAEVKHSTLASSAHITGTSIVRIKNGRFVEAWQNWDAAGLTAQLADTPPPRLLSHFAGHGQRSSFRPQKRSPRANGENHSRQGASNCLRFGLRFASTLSRSPVPQPRFQPNDDLCPCPAK